MSERNEHAWSRDLHVGMLVRHFWMLFCVGRGHLE
jgi:hypothetical protein